MYKCVCDAIDFEQNFNLFCCFKVGPGGGYSGEEGPRFPSPGGPQLSPHSPVMERWPQGPPMVRPPQPGQFRPGVL